MHIDCRNDEKQLFLSINSAYSYPQNEFIYVNHTQNQKQNNKPSYVLFITLKISKGVI